MITFILFVVILISISSGILITQYQSYDNFVQTRLKELNELIGKNALLLFHNVEALTRTTRTEVLLGVDSENLNPFLVNTVANMPQLRTVIYVNKDGIVESDSREGQPAVGIDVSDRQYFIVHKNKKTDNIFIDDPIPSRVDGKWSMPISLGVWENDEFRGIVVASIEPSYFSDGLNTYLIDHTPGWTGFIINSKGAILTSIPYDTNVIGHQVNSDHILSRLNRTITNEIFTDQGVLTEESSLIAVTQIHQDDLWLVFQQPWSDILSPFYIGVSITLIILIIAISLSYIVLRWQSDQSLKLVKQSSLISHERNILRTLINNIPSYIYIKNQDGQILTSNALFADPLSRMGATDLDPELTLKLYATDDNILKTGRTILEEELMILDGNGQQHWLSATKVPLYQKQSTGITGLIGILRDITDQRQAQEERIQTELLRREIQKERELVDLRQQFISTASHDFRTPLSIMKTSISLLEGYGDRLSPEKRAKKLNDIDRQIDHMVMLLDDVLLVSRANAGKVPFNPTSILLEPFCRDIWQDVLEVDHKQHTTQYTYEATVDTLHADQNLLHSALINLLSNAFKYTPQDGLIKFEIHSDEASITFTIEDSGSGIPESDQLHLFTPFYRATNTRDIEGTGLGLVIAKSYVELHNGTLTFESVENQGTTFTIKIPIN